MKHLRKFWERSNIIILLIFFSQMINLSCSTQNYNRNLKMKLFQENGNVFYMSSTYAWREIIWSYTKDKIIIYELSTKGRILKIRSELLRENTSIFEDIQNTDEINECIELNGDYLGYKILKEQVIEKEFLVNIKCFLKNINEIEVFNKIRSDMLKYNIILYTIEDN